MHCLAHESNFAPIVDMHIVLVHYVQYLKMICLDYAVVREVLVAQKQFKPE